MNGSTRQSVVSCGTRGRSVFCFDKALHSVTVAFSEGLQRKIRRESQETLPVGSQDPSYAQLIQFFGGVTVSGLSLYQARWNADGERVAP